MRACAECGADISERHNRAKWCVPCAEDRQRTSSGSKIYGVRVPARLSRVLEKTIRKSGHSQSEFFRIAIEVACSQGGIQASAFAAGRSAGHDDAGHLISEFAEKLAAVGKSPSSWAKARGRNRAAQ